MAKRRRAPPKREVTRRRLARWQRERRRRRITIFLGALTIALILAIVGYGYYTTRIAPPRQWLTRVNDTVFTGADYVKVLRLYFPSQSSPEAPLSKLEDDELVRQGAAQFGVSVSDEEIDEQIDTILEAMDGSWEDFEQLLNNLHLSVEEFRWFVATDLLQPKLDDYLREQVPESALQVHVQGVLVDTEEKAETVIEGLEGGEDFATLAEEHGQGDGDLGWIPEGLMGEEFDDVAFDLESGILSDPFLTDEGYWVIKVLGKEERDIEEDVREQLMATAFGRWLEEEREMKVERNPNVDLEKIYEWAMGQIS